MVLTTSHSLERSALRAGSPMPQGGISVKAWPIIEEALALGQTESSAFRLIELLRQQDYSIAEFLDDMKAAKTLIGAAYPDTLDELLIACINQTAVIHEAAIENMLHGFCELTVTGMILYANPALLALLPGCEGMSLDHYFPKHASDILGALDGSSGQRVHRMELEAPSRSCPVLAEFGSVRRGVTAYAFIIDLTHAQQAERYAHDTAPFAILKIDPDHRVTYANELASRLLGGTPQSVVGRNAGSLVQSQNDVDTLEREYAKRHRGETSEYELGLKPINQQPSARVMVRSIPETDPDGQLASTLVTLTPLSAELTAQRILEELSGATDAAVLFGRVLEHLRALVSFDAALLSVYTSDRSFSRVVYSEPVFDPHERWIQVPEALRHVADGPEPYGPDFDQKLRATQGGEALYEQSLVQALRNSSLRSWFTFPVENEGHYAVLTLLHQKYGYYSDETTTAVRTAGVRSAMQAVLRLEVTRERDFQFKLLQEMAKANTDGELASLVVNKLAEFYGWRNVSIFKVNVIQQRLELLAQAQAQRGGFNLPFDYRQALDEGFLGMTYKIGEIQIVTDASKSPDKDLFVVSANDSKTKSEMCVPIMLDRKAVWILNLEDDRPNTFAAPEKATVKRLMHELESSLERALGSALLDAVLSAVPDALVVTDLSGTILKCNLNAQKMLGGKPIKRPLPAFFPNDPEGAAATARETSYPVEGLVEGADGVSTKVLITARVPNGQYDRRVVTMQDSKKLKWQQETSELMQSLAEVASQVRVPLSLVSSFVRQIGREAADRAPRMADLAQRAVEQLGRIEVTYNRVIQQSKRSPEIEVFEIGEVLAEIEDALPVDLRACIQRRRDSMASVRADRPQFTKAARSMLAYLLRIGDPNAPVEVRLRAFGDAVGVSMTKVEIRESGGASTATVADEALARCALDEPGLHQFALSQGGLFRRRRAADGETLRLVLRTKRA